MSLRETSILSWPAEVHRQASADTDDKVTLTKTKGICPQEN